MIIAKSQTIGNFVKVHGVVGLNNWFKRRWLVGIGSGYTTLFYIVEACDESSVLDELVDSKHGHMIKISQDTVDQMESRIAELYNTMSPEEVEAFVETDPDLKEWWNIERAGNCGEPINANEIRIFEPLTEVNFFAPKETLGY